MPPIETAADRDSPRVRVARADELPPATSAIAVQSDRDEHGRFVRGNTAAHAQRTRPGPRGRLGSERCAEDYRPFARWGARYGAHRRRELAETHGGQISAGVGALVESAALAMASSRYLDHRARQTGDAELFRQAARLAETARQHELAAWELAAREAKVRPVSDPWARWRGRQDAGEDAESAGPVEDEKPATEAPEGEP
jgi:hypothetical protein